METRDKERIEKLKKLARSFFGQGAVGHAPNPDSDFEYAWRDYLETGMLCPWRTHRSDWEDEMRVDELLKDSTLANQQIEELKEQVDLQHEMARADQAKIAQLKKALRKASSFVGNSETHTLSDEKTVSAFIDEIENLLK